MRGRARRPPFAIVAPTLAIVRGVARSRSWPIAAAPTARSSRSSAGGEIVLGLASGIFGCSPNPKSRAARHEPARAELGPERREDRVAGVDERVGQRAAARLAARVAQRDARQGRRRPHRVARVRPRDPLVERLGGGDDLEDRAGRLRRRHREPGERAHRPVARADDGHAAEPVAERRPRRARQPGSIVVRTLRPADGARARDHALAEQQLRRRMPVEAVLVHPLEAPRDRAEVERRAVGGEHRAATAAPGPRAAPRPRRAAGPAAAARSPSRRPPRRRGRTPARRACRAACRRCRSRSSPARPPGRRAPGRAGRS